jgi:hypothetical protein
MKKFFAMVKETTGRDNTSKEKRLTWMMFSVVFLFVAANSMSNLSNICLSLGHISLETFAILRPIVSFSLTVNSSVNIFFYLYFNTTFRNNFFSIFPSNKPKNKKEQGDLTEMTKMTKLTS